MLIYVVPDLIWHPVMGDVASKTTFHYANQAVLEPTSHLILSCFGTNVPVDGLGLRLLGLLAEA